MRQSHSFTSIIICLSTVMLAACGGGQDEKRITRMDSVTNASMARQIEASVSPVLAEGLTLRVWAVDSLVSDPISLDIDDQGNLFYTRTNRQKHSEFDIRGHQDWE